MRHTNNLHMMIWPKIWSLKIYTFFTMRMIFCRRNGHMWLSSSRKDEGPIKHMQCEYHHCSLFLLEEISHVTTVPTVPCNSDEMCMQLIHNQIYRDANVSEQRSTTHGFRWCLDIMIMMMYDCIRYFQHARAWPGCEMSLSSMKDTHKNVKTTQIRTQEWWGSSTKSDRFFLTRSDCASILSHESSVHARGISLEDWFIQTGSEILNESRMRCSSGYTSINHLCVCSAAFRPQCAFQYMENRNLPCNTSLCARARHKSSEIHTVTLITPAAQIARARL